MRLRKEQIENMLPGQVLTAKCVSAAEWESAKRIAQRVKKEHQREDGEGYIVSQDVKSQTVSVETTNRSNDNH